METFFLVVIFFTPGLAMNIAYKYLNKKEDKEDNKYEYIFSIVLHSTVVFLVTYAAYSLLGLLFKGNFWSIRTFDDLLVRMDNLWFAILYLAVVLIITFVWYKVYHKRIQKMLDKQKDKKSKKNFGCTTISNSTVYEQIFHDPKNRGKLIPVEIMKNGKRVTCGCIKQWNSPNYKRMEFKLEYTTEIAELIDKGEILKVVRFSYYVPEHDLLIKFFKRNALEEHWNDKYKKSSS